MESLANLPTEKQLENIESLAKRLGIAKPSERPVLVIKSGENEKQKVLELVRGDWSAELPWFVIDEKGNLMVLSSAEAMKNIMQSLQHMGEEVFKARLERAIAKELPIDFHDVWTVAMHELGQRIKEGKTTTAVDLDNLIKNIKRKHPNLFYSLKDLDLNEQDLQEAGLD